MPELSRFFGIIIRMFREPDEPHHEPHLHAVYQDHVAVCGSETIDLMAGELPTRQHRLVLAWVELHQAELLADWKLVCSGHRPRKITPLRGSTVKHGIYRVTSFEIVGPRTLVVAFDDGTTQTIDFTPALEGRLYGALKDDRLFTRVSIDPEVHTQVWPNGADFDPETVHDWPRTSWGAKPSVSSRQMTRSLGLR